MSRHLADPSSSGPLLGRKRTKNHDLPPRLQRKGASYYYVYNNPRRWVSLGSNLDAAKRRWAEMECSVAPLSVGELVRRYIDARPLAESSKTQYRSFALAIEKDLSIPASELRAVHVALWRDRPENRGRPSYVNGCLAVLGAAWKLGREWGLVEHDVSVSRLAVVDRDLYLSDEDFRAVRDKAPEWLQVAMDLAYLTAMRPSDIRSMRWDQVGEVLTLRQKKTGHKQSFAMSPELAGVFARAKQRPILGLYVIANAKGRPMGRSGMEKAWRRACVAAGVKAQFRDIRAKAAIDAEAGGQDFQKLLGHASLKMSEHYLRGRKVIRAEPVRRKL